MFNSEEISQSGKESAGYYLDVSDGEWKYTNLSSLPVDKFFGVGCPSVLNDESPFTNAMKVQEHKLMNDPVMQTGVYNDIYIAREIFDNLDGTHFILHDLTSPMKDKLFELNEIDWGVYMIYLGSLFSKYLTSEEPSKISRNLLEFYVNLSMDNNSGVSDTSVYDNQFTSVASNRGSNNDFSDISVSNLYLFNANPSDLILNVNDSAFILQSVGYGEPYYYNGSFVYNHNYITEKEDVQEQIIGELNK